MRQTDIEYAEALFMLAAEDKMTEEYTSALDTVDVLLNENPLYIDMLLSPAIPLSERLLAIDEAFGSMPENVLFFIKLLCEKGHIALLPQCIKEFRKLAAAFLNTATAEVYSAVPLTDSQVNAICQKLKSITGKSVIANCTVDESLIGGVKIEFEGKTYDGSIKNRLHDIKDVIIG